MTTGVLSRGIDWRFVCDRLVTAGIAAALALFTLGVNGFRPEPSFVDAHIYFRATEAWVTGGNPWAAGADGFLYAAPPPALLLNLPLIPFGEQAAVAFWVVANAASVAFLLWRLRLPAWWVFFYPIAEGFLGGSPDVTLAAFVVAGVGPLAAATKPYAIPAMLADGRWRAVGVGVAAVLVTVPFLPWGAFLASGTAAALTTQSFPPSAFGQPVLMALTAVALLSLGPRTALALLVPALLATQPHYLVFALPWIARSRVLTLTMGLPVAHLGAVGVIVTAAVRTLAGLRGTVRSRGS